MHKIFKKLKKINWFKKIFLWFVHTPPFSWIYKTWYSKIIKNKLKNFKLSNLYVSIEPYNLCNAQCVMCPYQKMIRPKVKMSMQLYRKIIDDCLENGIESVNLNFYNEPFLDNLIFERIEYAKSKEIKVSLFSNGSVLNKEIIDQILDSGIDEIDFSFDGFSKKTYEQIRVNLNFEKTRDNILGLIEERNKRGLNKPKITMIFVKSDKNIGEVNDFKNFWKDKADVVGFSQDDNRNQTLDLSKFKTKKSIAYPCRKPWSELIVMSDGRVPLCCVDCDGSIILGDLNNQTISDVWNNEKFRKIRQLHLSYQADQIPICRNCLHLYRLNARSWF